MAYGIIDRRSHHFYTYMAAVFQAIDNAQLQYNWLLADCVCYPQDQKIGELLDREYLWLSGEALTALVAQEDFQWIWGVLCGFEKDIPLQDVLQYPLPHAEDYSGYYHNPVSLQHPLSTVEIVPSDSSWLTVISKEKSITDRYLCRCPQAEDLFTYNQRSLRP